MSLTFALSMTARGLQAIENRMTVTAQNITNADKTGYTRKTVTERYITTNAGTTPIYGQVSGTLDLYLSKTVIKDASAVGYRNTISEYLDLYGKQMGSTDGASTLSSYMNNLYSNFQILSTSSETNANKAYVVSIAQNLANGLRNISSDIQNQRLQADQKIEETVNNINNLVRNIHDMNERIASSGENDAGKAEYVDQRLQMLEELSADLNIQYFFDSSNRVQIYTQAGQALLTSDARQISYSATTTVNGLIAYPAGFGPLLLNGIDITNQQSSGALGGLIELRDVILVQEQEKHDSFARTLQFEMNAVLNRGTSLPPREIMTGTLTSLTPATAFSAAGTVRVGVVDVNGVTSNYTDINLTGFTTINDVLTALNGVANITASLDATGRLVVASTLPNTGVAIAAMTSDVGPNNQNFSHYFGLNDMFIGLGAETLNISSHLLNNNDFLPTGAFSDSLTLAAGDRGVARGDGSIANAAAELMSSNVNFSAAGNFSAQSNTLTRYMESIISNAASRAKIAQNEADTVNTIYSQTKNYLMNKTGVNIDEETARMVDLQSKYQAAASVIATIKTCFDALLAAVR
jgi:flagellar hook-associated protein 1 FlgK